MLDRECTLSWFVDFNFFRSGSGNEVELEIELGLGSVEGNKGKLAGL